MLNKLLKYEFKATGRLFLPAYAALLIIAAVQRVMLELDIYSSNNTIANIFANMVPMIFGAIVIAICVITVAAVIERFHKNLLGREGYLMFTLPVSVSELIWSKIIVVAVWCILSLIAGVLASLIMFATPQFFSELFNAIAYYSSQIHGITIGNILLWVLEVALLTIASGVSFVMMVYLCLSIGQLSNKHRGLCAVGAFIGINVVVNNTLAVIGVSIMDKIDLSGIEKLMQTMSEVAQINTVLLVCILVMVVQVIIYFLITRYILKNKLNLE